MFGAAALRSEAPRLGGACGRLAERGRPLVGGVLKHRPEHRAVPGRFAGPREDAVTLEPAANLTERRPFLADPREDPPHDPSLFGDDLIPRLTAALMLADVAVAVGRTAEHVDRTVAGGVLLAPATAFHDLGTLVLGDHA